MFRNFWIGLTCALVIGVGFSWGDTPKVCEEAIDNRVTDGRNDLIVCGTSECPESVKYDAIIGDPATLPNGFFVYGTADDKMFYSPLKEHNPVEINKDGKAYFNDKPIYITPDGKWFSYHNRGKFVNKEGVVQNTGFSANKVLLTGTDMEDLSLVGIRNQEIKKIKLKVTETNVSTEGQEEELMKFDDGSGKKNKPHDGESVLSQNYFFGIIKNIEAKVEAIDGPKQDYRPRLIPLSSVSGKITENDGEIVVSNHAFSCGLAISKDGSYIAGNFGYGYQDCYSGQHKGFAVFETEKYEDKGADWMSQEGVSVNWAPKNFEGFKMHAGKHTKSDFHRWHFTNYNEWIIGVKKNPAKPKGVWLVHWPSNTWYPLAIDKESVADVYHRAAAYFEDAPTVSITPEMRKRAELRGFSSPSFKDFDAAGRKVQEKGSIQPKF